MGVPGINFILSGGSNNVNPYDSLGGEPSFVPVVNGKINNLFDDVGAKESQQGVEDYRCVYVFNDYSVTVYNVNVYIYDEVSEGASVLLGTYYADEQQRIVISSGVNGGYFKISYDGSVITSYYNSDLATWSNQLELDLRNITDSMGRKVLEEASVNAQQVPNGDIVFDILFVGNSGKRSHEEIKLEENSLTPPTVNVKVSTLVNGGPINRMADEISNELIPPGGVNFSRYYEQSPLSLPLLYPGDGFPLWIKRSVLPNAKSVANDGIIIRVSSEIIPQNP